MMEFTKIAYCSGIPVLILLSWISRYGLKKYCINLIAVSNVLLIGYAVYLVRQLFGLYHLAKQLYGDFNHIPYHYIGLMIHLLLIIFLPLLALHGQVRKNRVFTVALLLLLYSAFPVSSWNLYDIPFKILSYLCLLCSAYALAWLLNKLPYQSPVE
jgi:hypothetical protein